jgi:hypothetical protein
MIRSPAIAPTLSDEVNFTPTPFHTFQKVSKKYLPLYVAEFRFRYNNQLNEDIFGEAIKGC